MTPAQEEIFNQIEQLMREHFPSAVLIVEAEKIGVDGVTYVKSTYHGGYCTAIGLLRVGEYQTIKECGDST